MPSINSCLSCDDNNRDKTFLVFNTACFGDVLLCNSLCQNIKNTYPGSKIVFICDKPFYDVAKYQKDVDEVVIYDKKGEHKGLFGLIKFIRNFPYNNIVASFITYKNYRNYLISLLLKTKKIIINSDVKNDLPMQIQHNLMLEKLLKVKTINFPIKYQLDNYETDLIYKDKKYIVLCTLTKKQIKDMPLSIATKFIKKVNQDGEYDVVFIGTGDRTQDYANKMYENGCDFINLTNKTTIVELAKVIKNSVCLVTVDTGTMHLGYSLDTPTVAMFFEQGTCKKWAPDEKIYNVKVLTDNIAADSIYDSLKKMLDKSLPKKGEFIDV